MFCAVGCAFHFLFCFPLWYAGADFFCCFEKINLQEPNMCFIFVLPNAMKRAGKNKKMIYASEFPEVQKSLGIEVTSEISEKPYADADRAAIASGRLEILEAPHPANAQMNMWGAFVDGQLKVLRANGNTIVLHNKDDEYKSKAAKIFGK